MDQLGSVKLSTCQVMGGTSLPLFPESAGFNLSLRDAVPHGIAIPFWVEL